MPRVPEGSGHFFERLFFCGIFSSNLDEYFRVRVASLRSLLRLGKGDKAKLGIVAQTTHAPEHVARIIGEELTVPSQAEPGVREAITNIAPMLTVHSEVAGMSDGLEEAQADSTPYLHILPAAEGLSFEMFNHPFGIEGPGFKPGEGAKGVILSGCG